MRTDKHLLGVGLAAATLAVGSSGYAAEMPQTMEEMWKIIQAQQREIEALKAKVQEAQKPQKPAEAPPKTAATPPAPPPVPKEQQVEELERKTGVLTEEVEKLKTQLVIPEKPEYKVEWGLGPAASEIYRVRRGLSIGGYGEARIQDLVANKGDNNDIADFVRAVLYTGYKFTDRILFNSEIEFEHGSTENNGSVSVEFAYLDFFTHPLANLRAGLVLLPIGLINEIHEPVTFFGNFRPEVETRVIPSTWREVGGGVFANPLPGLQYRLYAINGLNAEGFTTQNAIRGGRQNGSEAIANDFAFAGRLDYSPPAAPGLLAGFSTYLGDSGQDQLFDGQKPDVFTQLYEGHVQWYHGGLRFRALGSWGHIGDAELVSEQNGQIVGENLYGWYTEVGYDVMPHILPGTTQAFFPFFRYEQLNTATSAPDAWREIFQVGLSYYPHPQVVVKLDYRNFDVHEGTTPIPDDVNLGIGFIF